MPRPAALEHRTTRRTIQFCRVRGGPDRCASRKGAGPPPGAAPGPPPGCAL